MKKVCTVGLIGRPNVGKSTLMNHILGYDLSIVSNTAQTTRDDIRGIYNDDEYQIIFVDTPGIHKSEFLLSEKLNQKSFSILEEVDVVLFLTPANEQTGKGDKFIINKLNSLDIENKIALISKVDLVDDRELLDKKAHELKDLGFEKVFGVGLNMQNTYRDLIDELKTYAYESEPLYPEDQIGDVSLRFMAKEIIREIALKNLYFEVPHSIAVEINEFKEPEDDSKPYVLDATIFVKKQSQKAIVIGKNGTMIKTISMNARKKMEDVFDHKIYLLVKVKVDEDWVDNEQKIKKLGY
ncbi:GTPase Era [Metamycoplasma neophronis]|uniref:GTPase Era n=1 Tax=Metamycoplasma neophronis TaxID=872983 RepID=A0ABY2Z515_9BACT|nr:GTPase Era [Metamycoplasma neophronis]TPR53883.1 GTPase Era [Metamycoplasma neophronis]